MKFGKLTDRELFAHCKKYGSLSLVARRKFAGALSEVYRRRLYKSRGFGSIYEFAAKLAGMSRDNVDKVLRLHKRTEDKPALRALLESGEQGWSKLEAVASIATKETDTELAKKVKEMPKSALELYVRERNFSPGGDFQAEKVSVNVKLKREQVERLKALGNLDELMEIFLEFAEQSTEKEAKPEVVKTKSRHIPVNIQRFVLKKTHGVCAYPGCSKLYKIFHHTQRFALDKRHDTDEIVALCFGHERLAHLGLIDNEGLKPVFWKLRDEPDRNDPKYWIDEMVGLFRGG